MSFKHSTGISDKLEVAEFRRRILDFPGRCWCWAEPASGD
jgi:hypothetical protein